MDLNDKSRYIGVAAHALPIVCLFIFGAFACAIIPGVLWMIYASNSFVAKNAKEAFGFQATLYLILLGITVLFADSLNTPLMKNVAIIWLFTNIFFAFRGAIFTLRGQAYEYKLSVFRFF